MQPSGPFVPGQHSGTILRSGRQGRFALTETSYAPLYRTGWHQHGAAAICLVLQGGYVEQYRRRAIECNPGVVLLRPSGIEHDDRVSVEGARCFIVEPDPDWSAATMCESWSERSLPSPRVRWMLEQAYSEFRDPDPLSALTIEGLLLTMIADCGRHAARRNRHPPAWLARTREFLDHSFEVRITLSHLAEEAGVHPVHLSASFKRVYGCTVGEYVRLLRIEEARRQLVHTGRTIAQIAHAVGFSSQSHLTRTFRRVTGITPSQWRRNSRD
jgi:AraC family transcriptional regulator